MTLNFPRPEVTKAEEQELKDFVQKVFRSHGLTGLLAGFISLAIENTRLTKEVNIHREARGFEPLPTYKPKV